ncbi:L7Ae/L30e/S12e/Gadd45 family ribosomal protein [Qiania dongpingensis]|uniref:Ribosomal L7Ae/L30e/S12e/Gadd45 family protein n=1 Tax=Qiania dongpingensis TaxID=2763669 RepID=A0A7G9G3A4_9FIRM|nr:ribosomal L7Ae/L30e/S12e/Gadd45 family protein [Qiania dongpingensis]QNM05286.1 ribosomal L7Ae/L30e/S12e/Gadd45 family protein [Qiania dongpingensis]
MRANRVASLLGLAMKAGRLVSGEFLTEKAVKSMKATLVIVAEDASDNTKKMFTNMCTYYKVPLYFWGKKEDLGSAIGRELRASVALTDAGFRDAVVKQIESE